MKKRKNRIQTEILIKNLMKCRRFIKTQVGFPKIFKIDKI